MSEINSQALREAAERAIPAMERLLMLPADDDLLSEQELKDYGVDIDALNAFKFLTGPETVLALLDERERNQQYIKRRDQENEEIALTVGRLRVELEGKDSKIANLTAERDALREGEMGDARHSNTRAAADIYFQLVEECEIPAGGSLVEYVDDMREKLEAAENNLIDSECHVAELEEALRDKQALLEASEKRIAELRDWNAGLAQESLTYQQRVAELEVIKSAAEKLVRCKGRYHSEQNYRVLAALFGVTVPDLPPLEAEPVSQTYKSQHTQFEQVADLYEMQFDDGRTCAFHTDAQKAAQWLQACDGNRVQEYVKLERLRNALSGNYPVTPDGWISCSERMPDDAQWCVVDAADGYYVQCWSEGQGWLGDDISLRNCDVIRWMAIPEPPEQDGE
ncbi:ead/Ea22-like family protein [Escherichia coli]|nr:ead/Ea22-like family protein [Escherichia coli]